MNHAQYYKRKHHHPDTEQTIKRIKQQAGLLITSLSRLPCGKQYEFEKNPIKIMERFYVQNLTLEAISWLSDIAFDEWHSGGQAPVHQLADEINVQTVLPITDYYQARDIEAQWRSLSDMICNAADKPPAYGYQFHSSVP